MSSSSPETLMLDDIFSEDEHERLDAAVMSRPYISLLSEEVLSTKPAYELQDLQKRNIVTETLKGVLENGGDKLRQHVGPDQLIRDVPNFYELAEEAVKTGSFRHIRNLSQLRETGAQHGFTLTSRAVEDSSSIEATEKSWRQSFRGQSAGLLYDIFKSYLDTQQYGNCYARYVTFAQSSGTGKSRMNDELAKRILYIPINLGPDHGEAFPPPDKPARSWFESPNSSRKDCEKRCQAFLYGVLVHTKLELERLEESMEVDPSSKPLERLQHLSSEFREKMSEGMSFKAHGEYRKAFYTAVEALAMTFLNSARLDSAQGSSSPINKYTVQVNGTAKDVQSASQELYTFLDPSRFCIKLPVAVLCFDESHRLVSPIGDTSWTWFSELRRGLRLMLSFPIFAVFLSTAGKFHQFAPASQYESSSRMMQRLLEPFPPIIEVGFDEFADQVSLNGSWTLERLASTYHIAHLGRALFATRYDSGDPFVKEEIINFAQEKLLHERLSPTAVQMQSDQTLACLGVRLTLEFKATSWLDREIERTQVERHMRLCIHATAGFESMVTVCPSEPILAEAAFRAMEARGMDPAAALLQHLDNSHLDAGLRGELIAQVLLLLARDKATRKVSAEETAKNLKCDGETTGRIVTMEQFLRALLAASPTTWQTAYPSAFHTEDNKKELQEALKGCYIWFNHFVKISDRDNITQQYLCCLLARGAAVVCANNQRGVDIIIPFLRGKSLCVQDVSAILVQVKNDVTFSTTVKPHLFAAMDPFDLGLFAETSENLPPVVRLVFALASDKSTVTLPVPERTSPRTASKFTVYDIWCAGALAQTFGVIAENQHETFKTLLLRSQNVSKAYLTSETQREVWKDRGETRRTMVPGTSKNPTHIRNYIDIAPYIAPFAVPTKRKASKSEEKKAKKAKKEGNNDMDVDGEE